MNVGLSYLLLVLFLTLVFTYGYFWANRLLKIKSVVLLIPLSLSFGISAYLFLVHIFSYITGPQKASIIGLILITLVNLFFLLNKSLKPIHELEVNKSSLITLVLSALSICFFTYLSVFRFGIFDQMFHDPLALTLFHNDVYPPKDFLRPEYILLYHFGGDLLAGSIKQITGIGITRCFEIISTICSGVIFLSFTALAWILTKDFRISYICGFCTYFSGGILWLDAIFRFLLKNLPENLYNSSFLEVFTTIGIHGSVVNAPAILAFSSTSSLGIHMLIFSLIIFWQMINLKERYLIHLTTLSISLLSLSICAEWLHLTFFAGVIPLTLIYFLKKNYRACRLTLTLVTISLVLNKTIGDALFLQNELQKIGRTSILNIGIKENLFEISAWGRLNPLLNNYEQFSCFSWDFISEFGFSLILLLFVVYYTVKEKNFFATLLFFCALFTMPAPLVLDFRTNPTDFNRMFCFGNEMLILLGTYSISKLFKSFFQNKALTFIYIIILSLSPFSQLLLGSVFTPHIYTSKMFSKTVFDLINKGNLKSAIKIATDISLANRNKPPEADKGTVNFLIKNSHPGDVAISNQPDLPLQAGIYSLVPAKSFIYQDQVYSPYSSLFTTVFSSFDLSLIKELNLKWVIIKLPKNSIFPNVPFFNLAYSHDTNNHTTKVFYIDLSKVSISGKRKTAWILTNKNGHPIEAENLRSNEINLFPSMKSSLTFLLEIYKSHPDLKKELITSQPIIISEIESGIEKINQSNHLSLKTVKHF